VGFDSPALFSIRRCWFPFAVVGSRSLLLTPVHNRWLSFAIVGSRSLSLVPVRCWLSFALVGSLCSCVGPLRRFCPLAFVGFEFMSLDSSSSSSGRIIVIRRMSLGLGGLWLGVLVWVKFVTSVSGVRELERTMWVPMFPLPHLLILLNTNETRLRPSKGGRPGQGYAIDATAHIPQDRGGADMRDVQCQPTSLGGAGSGVGVLRWW